jgi:cytochrome c2
MAKVPYYLQPNQDEDLGGQLVQDALAGKQLPPVAPAPAVPDIGGDLVSQALTPPQPVYMDQFAPTQAPVAPPSAFGKKSGTSGSDINPVVKDYIAKKYGFSGDLSDDSLKAAQKSAQNERFIADMGTAGNTIGAALAGVKADNSFYDKMRDGAGQGVKDIQERRKGQIDDMSYGKALKEQAETADEDEINSPTTKTYQMLASKMLPGKDFSNLTAGQIKRLIPSLEKVYQVQEQTNSRLAMAKMLQGARAAKDADAKSLTGRLSKLGAEGKQRLDNAMMAYRAVKDMSDALDKGDNTFSIIGDNNFTEAKRRYTEGLGRMQSGGQISGPEMSNFGAMVPGARDAKEMQQKKLRNAEHEMLRRIKTLGFDPKEVDADARGLSEPSAGQTAFDVDAIDAILKQRGAL